RHGLGGAAGAWSGGGRAGGAGPRPGPGHPRRRRRRLRAGWVHQPLAAREAALMAAGRPVFVSPHADDAVLSCGGTIGWLADAGRRPLVATIFAGEIVDEMAGGFARWKHERWKLTNVDEVRWQRAAEDAAAA